MSNPSDKKDAKEIFQAAIEYYLPQQWEGYIHDACGEDEVLREKVRGLLNAHGKTDSFFDNKRDGQGEPPEITERPGSQIGPYKLLQAIGEGGFGVVYMADQQRPVRRKVALKIIKPGMDTKQVIARFEAERQALAMMDHPNIAKVLDAGSTDSGRPYFVMELVKGVPITEFCDTNKLSNQQRLELFATVCRAVQHAHLKGVIHRDLKPSNVMVTLHDYKPMPVVIDFGVSKAISTQLTEKTLFTAYGQMVGTPAYMSPEQAHMSRMDIDTRSDIYSLGVMLYELLTGGTPLSADELRGTAYAELQRRIREEEAPKPSTRLSTLGKAALKIAQDRNTDPRRLGQFLSGDLDWIVLKALDKDRSRRYETANGLANDIERFLGDEAVEACPPSVAYQMRKFVGRNRGLVTTASLVLSAVLLGIIGTTVGMLRARHEADVAQHALAEASHSRDIARTLAEEKQQEAESARKAQREAKAQAAKQLMMRAGAERERGDITLAALLGAEALKQDTDDEQQRLNHRRRLTADLRQCPRPTQVLLHDTAVADARFSGDGRWIVTCSKDGTVRIYDAQTGEVEQALQHEGTVNAVTFMLDDTRLLTHEVVDIGEAESLYDRGRIHLWDWRRGKSLADHACLPQNDLWGDEYYLHSSYSIVAGSNVREMFSAVDGQPLGPKLQTERSISIDSRPIDDTSMLVILAEQSDDNARRQSPLSELIRSRRGGSPTKFQIWFADTGNTIPLLDHSFAPPSTVTPLNAKRGQKSIALSVSGSIHTYDAETGQLRWRTNLAETRDQTGLFGGNFSTRANGWIRVEKFSPGGRTLLCRQENGLALIDVATGAVGATIQASVSDTESALFSPDGKRVLAINDQGDPQIWDVETGRIESRPIELDAKVQDFGFSPDGRFVKVASGIGTIQVWDTQTEQSATPLLRHPGTIEKSAFSRDGSHLLVAAGNHVYLWPIGWPEFRQVEIDHSTFDRDLASPGTRQTNQAHITPDGKRVLTLTFATRGVTKARVFNASTGRLLAGPIEIDGAIPSVTISRNGRTALISRLTPVSLPSGGGEDGARRERTLGSKATIWQLDSGQTVELATGGGGWIDGGLSDDGTVAWTTTTTIPLGIGRGTGNSRGRGRIVRTPIDTVTRIWDARAGDPLGPPIEHLTMGQSGGALAGGRPGFRRFNSPNNQLKTIVCSGGERLIVIEPKEGENGLQELRDSNRVRVIDTRTGELAFQPLEHTEGPLSQLLVSDDGKRLVGVSRDIVSVKQTTLHARVWDLEHQGALLHQRSFQSPPASTIEIDPTGTRFATRPRFAGGPAGLNVIQVGEFDNDHVRPLLHQLGVRTVAFGPDSQSILTTCSDGIMRIWETETGELVQVLEPDSDLESPIFATFSSDGRRIVASYVGNAHPQIWDVASGQRLTPQLETVLRTSRAFGFQPSTHQGRWVSRAANRLLVQQKDKYVICDLSPDSRPLEDLIRMTQLLSGRRVNEFGNVESIPSGQWTQQWESSQHDLYDDLIEPLRGEAWHRRLVDSTTEITQTLWHLDRLIDAGVTEGELYEQRGDVLAELGQYQQAISDYKTAEELGENVGGELGHCFVLLRRWDEAAGAYARSNDGRLERTTQERRTGAQHRFREGLSHLLAGNAAEYERICQAILDMPLGRLSAPTLERHIRLALLVPRDEDDCQKLQDQLDQYIAASNPPPSADSWVYKVEQLLAFRRGDYEAALKLTVELEPGSDSWSMSRLIQAMSHKKLGQDEEARELLGQVIPPVAEPSLDLKPTSRTIVETSAQIVGLFYKEAVELIVENGKEL